MRLSPRIPLAVVFCTLWAGLTAQTTGPENGTLYIHGGGKLNTGEFVTLVQKQTGKDQPVFRIITTAQGGRRETAYEKGETWRMVETLRNRFDLNDVEELYTLSPERANERDFYEEIDHADAIFMSGGNQSFLTDAFLGTESYAAMKRLLERGGVIGGSSAGAQVQSSFMTRGDYQKRTILGDREHQQGFEFITNSAFDVHIEERNREKHLFQIYLAKKSQLQDPDLDTTQILGMGIDQGTALIVFNNQLRVSGLGVVRIFDPHQWREQKPFYQELKPGEFYSLTKRRKLSKQPTP